MWKLLTDERSRQAIEVAERYADALATADELMAAFNSAGEVLRASRVNRTGRGWYKNLLATAFACSAAGPKPWNDVVDEYLWQGANVREQVVCCEVLRDMFNPFTPPGIAPNWLTWNDGAIRKMAQGIYDEYRIDDLPILADALEDASCDNADLLAHCRGPGPHVRGCWVIDLLLGKE
jgi:hypothetical protein